MSLIFYNTYIHISLYPLQVSYSLKTPVLLIDVQYIFPLDRNSPCFLSVLPNIIRNIHLESVLCLEELLYVYICVTYRFRLY